MTEEEWLNTSDSRDLLRIAEAAGCVSDRKFRVFACACIRNVLPSVIGPDAFTIMEAGEQIADNWQSDTDVMQEAYKRIAPHRDEFGNITWHLAIALSTPGQPSASVAATLARDGWSSFQYRDSGSADMEAQVALVRDIFGNPFRPIDFAAWRTDTALALARQMYESRDFGAMPILADALQDAGCDSEDVLNHCRDTSATHYRGCWVVDGVLGKE
jgi:hypothetical protein